MDLIFPDSGLVRILDKLVTPKVIYNLYRNDVVPGLADTLATYLPAAWSGYAAKDVLRAAWAFSAVVAHVGALSAADLFWTNSSGLAQTVYGYYVTDETGAVLIAAARFDTAPVVVATGKFVQVTPILGSFSGLVS